MPENSAEKKTKPISWITWIINKTTLHKDIELFITLSVFGVAVYIATISEMGRTFLPFMVVAYIVAAFAYVFGRHTTPDEKSVGLIAFLFSPKIWFHKSAMHDYYMIIINAVLVALLLRSLLFPPEMFYEILKPVFSFLSITETVRTPSPAIIIFFIISTYVASDVMYFFAHRLMHKIPWIWEFHKIHHAAEVMTPLTLHRAHPIELWMSMLFRTFGQAAVSGIFLFFYPGENNFYTVAEINVLIIVLNITVSNLRHSHVWISFGPKVEKFIMSPAQHQIHHSTQIKHYDKNFGSFLSMWDWMFGSLYVTTGREEVVFGLGKEKESAKLNTVWDLYWTPFVRSFKILFKR